LKKLLLIVSLLANIWAGPIAYDAKEVLNNGKYSMFIFGTDRCHFCKKLTNEIEHSNKVKAIMKKHYNVYYFSLEKSKQVIFEGKSISSRYLAQIYGFQGSTPFVVFINEKGDNLGAMPGYLPENRLINALDYLGERYHEKKISFSDYLKRKQK
jgi:thioredoxin-related protein